jgi:hypothetical protein
LSVAFALLILWEILTEPSRVSVVALLLLILVPVGAIALKRKIGRKVDAIALKRNSGRKS